MTTINSILQQLKKKEEQDSANAKRIKECESIIKAEEGNIQELKQLKLKLTEDLAMKEKKNCEMEVNVEILDGQKTIWTDLLNQTRKELQEEEATLEALQQTIFQNRATFCDSMWDYLNKNNWLKTFCGVPQHPFLTSKNAVVVKSERDEEEYNTLLETVQNLENELEELTIKETQIEEAKLHKLKLLAEPSSGDQFVRIQQSIKDTNDKVNSLDEQIRSIKQEISLKDLLLLNKRELNESETPNPYQSKKRVHSSINDSPGKNTSVPASTSGSKMVKFNDLVQMRKIGPSPNRPTHSRTSSSVLPQSFKITLPSRSIQTKRSHKELTSMLNEEMNDILFNKQ